MASFSFFLSLILSAHGLLSPLPGCLTPAWPRKLQLEVMLCLGAGWGVSPRLSSPRTYSRTSSFPNQSSTTLCPKRSSSPLTLRHLNQHSYVKMWLFLCLLFSKKEPGNIGSFVKGFKWCHQNLSYQYFIALRWYMKGSWTACIRFPAWQLSQCPSVCVLRCQRWS